jgi:hypothetical protein
MAWLRVLLTLSAGTQQHPPPLSGCASGRFGVGKQVSSPCHSPVATAPRGLGGNHGKGPSGYGPLKPRVPVTRDIDPIIPSAFRPLEIRVNRPWLVVDRRVHVACSRPCAHGRPRTRAHWPRPRHAPTLRREPRSPPQCDGGEADGARTFAIVFMPADSSCERLRGVECPDRCALYGRCDVARHTAEHNGRCYEPARARHRCVAWPVMGEREMCS